MNLILDTHVWIWSQECPDRLGAQTQAQLTDGSNTVCVSTASTLEIARLIEGGLLELDGSLGQWVTRSLDVLRCQTVELSHDIAVAAYALPPGFHKDPADRIIVATARLRDLTLVTADERILAYPHVRCLDARG